MKYIINENEINDLLKRILEQNGLERTLDITGLNVFKLFDKIEPFVINSDLSYDLIYHIFTTYNDILTKKIGHYSLNFNFDGIMEWDYKNKGTKETMYSLCTPYWDGDAMTPIQVENYYNGERESEIYPNDEFYGSFKCPKEFNSLIDLMYWYNNEYIPKVYNKLNFFLKTLRENL